MDTWSIGNWPKNDESNETRPFYQKSYSYLRWFVLLSRLNQVTDKPVLFIMFTYDIVFQIYYDINTHYCKWYIVELVFSRRSRGRVRNALDSLLPDRIRSVSIHLTRSLLYHVMISPQLIILHLSSTGGGKWAVSTACPACLLSPVLHLYCRGACMLPFLPEVGSSAYFVALPVGSP